MKIITKAEATPSELHNIHIWVHSFLESLGALMEVTENAEMPLAQSMKAILGVGISAGALGKYENLLLTEDGIITFDAWIAVNQDNPRTYYLVHVRLDTVNKEASVKED